MTTLLGAPRGLGYGGWVTESTPSPRTQPQYQIRFDWGLKGAAAIAEGAHVVVWVDALTTALAPDPLLIEHPVAILRGTVGNCDALAAWVLQCQIEIGDRATVAVVAAGSDDGGFAVEDLLAAGAVIDALAEVGIDYISPEAAAAVGAFTGLRNATGHVLSASVAGQQIIAAQGRGFVDDARHSNSQPSLTVLREFSLLP
jgi:2-phosphosulfolactate phosphatase